MATDAMEGSPKSGHSNGGSPSLAKRFKQESKGRSPKFGHRKKASSPKKSPNLSTPKTPKKSHSPRWCRSPKLKHQNHVESPSIPRKDCLSPNDIANNYETYLTPTIRENNSVIHPPTDSNHNATNDCHHKETTCNNNNTNDNVVDNLSASTQSLARPSLFRRFMNWQQTRSTSRSARSSQSDLDQLQPSPRTPDGRLLTPTDPCAEESRSLAPPSPRSRGLFANFKRERFVSAVANTKNKFFNITGLHRGIRSPANPSSDRSPQVSPTSIAMATAEGVEGDPEKSRRESVQEWLDNLTDLPHPSTEDLVGASEVPPEVVMTSHVEAVGASGKLDHDDLNLGAEAKMMTGEGSAESLHDPPIDLAAALVMRHTPHKKNSHHWEDRFGLFQRESISVSSSTSDMIWESVDNLLNERTGDPEELLTSLGFVSAEVQEDSFMRIPERFLMNPSVAPGISLEGFLNTHPDLREMVMLKRSFHQPAKQPDDEPIPSILQPAEPRRSFYDVAFAVSMISRFKTPRKSIEALYARDPEQPPAPVHFGLTPTGKRFNSILHPDNSEAHAVSGMYDDVENQPSLPSSDKLRRAVAKLRCYRRNELPSQRISSVDPGDATRAAAEAEREKRTKSQPSCEWDASSVHSNDSIPQRFRKSSTLLPSHLLSFSLDHPEGDTKSVESQPVNFPQAAKLLSVPTETIPHVSSAPELHMMHNMQNAEAELEPVRKVSEVESHVPSSVRSSVSSIAKLEDVTGVVRSPDTRVRFSLTDEVINVDKEEEISMQVTKDDEEVGMQVTNDDEEVGMQMTNENEVGMQVTGEIEEHKTEHAENEVGIANNKEDIGAVPMDTAKSEVCASSVSSLIYPEFSMDLLDPSNMDVDDSVNLIGDDVDESLVGQDHIEKWLRELPGHGVEDNRRDSDIRDELLGYEPSHRGLHSSQSVPAMDTSISEEAEDTHKMRSASMRQDSVADKRRKFSRQSQVSTDNQENVPSTQPCDEIDSASKDDDFSNDQYDGEEPVSFISSESSKTLVDDNGNIDMLTSLSAISNKDVDNNNRSDTNSDEAAMLSPDANLNTMPNIPSSPESNQNLSQSQSTTIKKPRKSSKVLHLIQNLESSIQAENELSPNGKGNFDKISPPLYENVEKKENRETINLQKYTENTTLTAVQSALVSSLSGSKHPPKIVSYMLARRDSSEMEKGQQEEPLVFKSDTSVSDMNSDKKAMDVKETEAGFYGGELTVGGGSGEKGATHSEKKQVFADKSKVECSFELEEINSEDMVIDSLPSLAVRRNLKGSLVRTGSAQSDSSGFVEADTLETVHPSELDWGRLKVSHLDSSGSDSQGQGHPSTLDTPQPGTSDGLSPELTKTQGSLDSVGHSTLDTTGSDTVIISDTEVGLHSPIAAHDSSLDESMGISLGKGPRKKSEVRGYTADEDISDTEVWMASVDGDQVVSPKKVKKLRKRSKLNSESDKLDSLTSGEENIGVVMEESQRKSKLSKINKAEDLVANKTDMGVLRTSRNVDSGSMSDTMGKEVGLLNTSSSSIDPKSIHSDSPHLVAELYVDPLTPTVSHVSEVVLLVDKGEIKQIEVSDKEEEMKQDVMWCVNYGVHEVSAEQMAAEHSDKYVSTDNLSSEQYVHNTEHSSHDERRRSEVTEHYQVTAEQGVYHLEPKIILEPKLKSRPHYWSDRSSDPPSLADELRMAENRENLSTFTGNETIESNDLNKVPLLATSTPLLKKPPPKPPRSPMLANGNIGNVSCLHLNVQTSPEGAKYSPRKMSSPAHVCPPLYETARQQGVLCSLLKQSGAWSPALDDISSRNTWDFNTSDVSIRSVDEHTQFLLDQATLLQNALAKYKHDFQEIVNQARLVYDSSTTTKEEKEKISELFDLGENILCEVWELERHLAGRIDDLISGRDDQDMNDYVLDFSSLNILREVIELLKEQVHHRSVIHSLSANQNLPDDNDDPVTHEELAAMAKDVPDAPSTKQVLEQLAVIQRDLMEQNNRASMQLNSSIKELRESLLEEVREVVKKETNEMRVHLRTTEHQVAHLKERLNLTRDKEHLRTDSGFGPEYDGEPSPTPSNGHAATFEVPDSPARGTVESPKPATRGKKASSSSDVKDSENSKDKENTEPKKQSKKEKR